MAVWRLQCINRESGAESEEVVEAESQQDAIFAVNQRGLMVGKVDRIAGPPPSPSVAERNAPKRTARPALPASLRSMRSLKEGRALAVIGSLVMLFAGLAMDTAVNGVINISLLDILTSAIEAGEVEPPRLRRREFGTLGFAGGVARFTGGAV